MFSFLFHFSYTSRSITDRSQSYDNSIFILFKELLDCFPKWLYHFTFQPEVYESSKFSMSLMTLVTIFLRGKRSGDWRGGVLWIVGEIERGCSQGFEI